MRNGRGGFCLGKNQSDVIQFCLLVALGPVYMGICEEIGEYLGGSRICFELFLNFRDRGTIWRLKVRANEVRSLKIESGRRRMDRHKRNRRRATGDRLAMRGDF
jgi:hypothetical protein